MSRRPHANDLPENLPLLPLRGALLLPRADLPLHIFEPRYLTLVEDALMTSHRLIGMICPLSGDSHLPVPDDAPLTETGCAGRITSFSEIENNRMLITLHGISRFCLLDEIVDAAPYRRARADWGPYADDLGPAEEDDGLDRTEFIATVMRYLALHEYSADAKALSHASDEELINALAMLCPFRPEDKQALLEAPDLPSRREALMALLEFSLLGGDSTRMVPH